MGRRIPDKDWDDVKWNWDAASAAVAKLREVAGELERMAENRSAAAQRADEGFKGTYRDQFASYLYGEYGYAAYGSGKLRANRNFADQCRSIAGRIERLSDQARREQGRREASRASSNI
jgi:hypothetical protein